MAIKKIELKVDIIGGDGTLTDAEEKALSDFFKQRKAQQKSKLLKKGHKSNQNSQSSKRQVMVNV
jgi:hypothetical protein